jgi:hypothetical protein
MDLVKKEKAAQAGAGQKDFYYCPMHPNFTSNKPGDCAICGMSLVKKTAEKNHAMGHEQHKNGKGRILYYRNPMNPSVTSPVPMKDEMGMDYIPVYEEPTETAHKGFQVSPQKQQLIGVQKGRVEKRRLRGEILTVGQVAYDPNLFVAQEEYLQAIKSRKSMQQGTMGYGQEQADTFIKTAQRRLMLMGMSEAEIRELEKTGKAQQNLYLPDPEDKSVWVYLTVYEYEAGFVKEGLPIEVRAIAFGGEVFKGKIISIAPLLQPQTRSLKVRALVENPENRLKLDMYVNARIEYDLGEKLAVPEQAVLKTGTRNIVFIAKPDGYFEPRDVKIGHKAQGYYEVLEGLAGGEEIVTSGNFLIDSESKLSAVLNQMGEPNQ